MATSRDAAARTDRMAEPVGAEKKNHEQHVDYGRATVAVSPVLIGPIGPGLVASQDRHPGTHQVPKFEVDPSWPKIPNGWVLGPVSSVAVDEQQHVWVLHRPRAVVRPDQKTGPPVMELDAAGNYIQARAGQEPATTGPSPRMAFSWTLKAMSGSEQGEEDQILKFTKSGGFVMQLGHGVQKTNQVMKISGSRRTCSPIRVRTSCLWPTGTATGGLCRSTPSRALTSACGLFGNVPADEPAMASALARPAAAASDTLPEVARVRQRLEAFRSRPSAVWR
jgi:hypothetical protein